MQNNRLPKINRIKQIDEHRVESLYQWKNHHKDEIKQETP